MKDKEMKMLKGFFIIMLVGVSVHALDVQGTWVKPCSYDPIPGEKKPNYSTITATLKQRHIDIEINYFTDSACRSPWKLMPTFLQAGTYTVSSKKEEKKIKGKKRILTPIDIRISQYDNHARFKTPRHFTVYLDLFFRVYIRRNGRTYVLNKAIIEPKARVAKEVYKQDNHVEVCVLTMKVAHTSFSWCLENMTFPKEKFRAYCEASKPEENGDLRYDKMCPLELKSSSCVYGLKQLGHNLRRWYSKEELETNPRAQKACETQLRGVWGK